MQIPSGFRRDLIFQEVSGIINNYARHTIPREFLDTLRRDGVLRHPNATLTPLTDGVSSEIFRVDDGGDTFVVKRALAKLRVKDEWTADIDRNRYEQMYIKYVAQFLPHAVPSLRPGAMDRGYFVMEFLGPEFTSWKQLLLRGETRAEDAIQLATVLGQIHAHSVSDSEAARQFDTTSNFRQLRIDPYLLTTGSRHPELREFFETEAQRLESTRLCLVHGDFSPKNIMRSNTRLVLLDCEVAWYGDPAFDLAFLMTHLLLKGLYHAPREIGLQELCRVFVLRYVEETSGLFDLRALEPRVARLLLMLLLARVDGKSPVEYVSDPQETEWVRRFARKGILEGRFNLNDVVGEWFSSLWERKVRG